MKLAVAGSEGPCVDIMEISKPDDLGDIANLGLTLTEAKQLLARVQREISTAQARQHAVQWPVCPCRDGVCRVKDYRDHAVATLFGQVTLRLPRFRCGACVRHAGQVVTRTMPFEEVWNYHHIEPTNVIDVHIGKLRRKTDPDEATSMIQTGPGRRAHLCQRRLQGHQGLGQRPWHPCRPAGGCAAPLLSDRTEPPYARQRTWIGVGRRCRRTGRHGDCDHGRESGLPDRID